MELSREDLIAAVTEGVRQAFAEIANACLAKLDELDIADAIESGTHKAFDQLYASEIAHAITTGTRIAIEAR